MPLHIAIADDHGAIRMGLKYIIQAWRPGTTISFAERFNDLITLLEDSTVDFVILDINLPGGNNFQMVDLIKEKSPGSRVLIFSAYEEELYALRYLDAGADGYLHKSAKEEDIKQALNTIFTGGKYLSNRIKDLVLERRLQQGRIQDNPLLELSNREMEVCRLLVNGLGVSEIANALELHTSTIGTYKSSIFEKLAVRNITELLDTFRMYNGEQMQA